ncbi:hypothetical protein CASFOL_032123 [Castilleja foliolosa]|uniref:Uncharacterized protein n=1 Tax=Castilleja foliolosa TaxID=1961234 RepID=A0ABD3C154_9LAMI
MDSSEFDHEYLEIEEDAIDQLKEKKEKGEASTIPWNLDDKWLEDAKKWVQEEPKPDDKLVTEASKWLEPAEKWMEEKLEEEPADKWEEAKLEEEPADKWEEAAAKWLEAEAAATKPDDKKWPARKWLMQHELKGKRKEPSDEVDPDEGHAMKKLKNEEGEGSCEEEEGEGNCEEGVKEGN